MNTAIGTNPRIYPTAVTCTPLHQEQHNLKISGIGPQGGRHSLSIGGSYENIRSVLLRALGELEHAEYERRAGA